MENATKALLMAGGILIAILLITLAVNMFGKTGNVAKTYSATISQEEITTFNSNFTKYLGKPFTRHVAETIINFANSNNVTVDSALDTFENKLADDTIRNAQYNIIINDYDENGYINYITIQQ